MCFFFCIDIFSLLKMIKRKNVTPIKRPRASSTLKEEYQENFNGELEAK